MAVAQVQHALRAMAEVGFGIEPLITDLYLGKATRPATTTGCRLNERGAAAVSFTYPHALARSKGIQVTDCRNKRTPLRLCLDSTEIWLIRTSANDQYSAAAPDR
jgi:hypothetical protein